VRPLAGDHGSGLNLDGLNPVDPFNAGNKREAERLLGMMGIGTAALISGGGLGDLQEAAPHTICVNKDLDSGIGTQIGSFLGLDGVRDSCRAIESRYDYADTSFVLAEAGAAEERINYAADKYLKRHDPPRVAIFSGFAYGAFAAKSLTRYLDADIACICTRNKPSAAPYRVEQTISLQRIREVIADSRPDLVIGSSFERSFSGDAAFTGLTPPLRGRVRLSSRPIIGIEGELSFMEDVLNACLDRERHGTTMRADAS
jgi:nitrogenase molybdenum-iron protein alpha/beta subunit